VRGRRTRCLPFLPELQRDSGSVWGLEP